MPLQNKTCRTCNSFVEYSKFDGPHKVPVGKGDCRRFPPLSSGHRKVNETYWCGEWTPVEGGRYELGMRPFTPIPQAGPSFSFSDGQKPKDPKGEKLLDHESSLGLGATLVLQGYIREYVKKIKEQEEVYQRAIERIGHYQSQINDLDKVLDKITGSTPDRDAQ